MSTTSGAVSLLTLEAIDEASSTITAIDDSFLELIGTVNELIGTSDALQGATDLMIQALSELGQTAVESAGSITEALTEIDSSTTSVDAAASELGVLQDAFLTTAGDAGDFAGVFATTMGAIDDDAVVAAEAVGVSLSDMVGNFGELVAGADDAVTSVADNFDVIDAAAEDSAGILAKATEGMTTSLGIVATTMADTADTAGITADRVDVATASMGTSIKDVAGVYRDSFYIIERSNTGIVDGTRIMGEQIAGTSGQIQFDLGGMEKGIIATSDTFLRSYESISGDVDGIAKSVIEGAASVSRSAGKMSLAFGEVAKSATEEAAVVEKSQATVDKFIHNSAGRFVKTADTAVTANENIDKSVVGLTDTTVSELDIQKLAWDKLMAKLEEAQAVSSATSDVIDRNLIRQGTLATEAGRAGGGGFGGGGGILSKHPILGTGLLVGGAVALKGAYKQATANQAAIADQAATMDMAMGKITKWNALWDNAAKHTEYSNLQISEAMQGVIGKLQTLAHGHLTAAEAQGFLDHAMLLGTATDQNLGDATLTLVTGMTAFGGSLAHTKNQMVNMNDITASMVNTSRGTGASLSNLDMVLQRIGSKFAGSGIKASQFGGFLLDLQAHGLQGSRGILSATQAIASIIHPSEQTAVVLKQIGFPMDLLTGKTKNLQAIFQALHTDLGRLPTAYNNAAEQLKGMNLQTDQSALSAQTATIQSEATLHSLNAVTNEVLQLKGAQGSQIKMALAARFAQQQLQLAQQMTQLQDQKQTAVIARKIALTQTYQAALGKAKLQLDRNNASTQLLGQTSDSLGQILLTKNIGGLASYTKQAASMARVQHDAQVAAQTHKYQLQQLHKNMADLELLIGNKVVPTMVKLAGAAIRLLTVLIHWGVQNGKLVATVAKVVGVLYALNKIKKMVADNDSILRAAAGWVKGFAKMGIAVAKAIVHLIQYALTGERTATRVSISDKRIALSAQKRAIEDRLAADESAKAAEKAAAATKTSTTETLESNKLAEESARKTARLKEATAVQSEKTAVTAGKKAEESQIASDNKTIKNYIKNSNLGMAWSKHKLRSEGKDIEQENAAKQRQLAADRTIAEKEAKLSADSVKNTEKTTAKVDASAQKQVKTADKAAKDIEKANAQKVAKEAENATKQKAINKEVTASVDEATAQQKLANTEQIASSAAVPVAAEADAVAVDAAATSTAAVVDTTAVAVDAAEVTETASFGAVAIAAIASAAATIAAFAPVVIAFAPVIAIVVALAAAAFLIYKNWHHIEMFFKATWNAIVKIFKWAWDYIHKIINVALTIINLLLHGKFGQVEQMVSKFWKHIVKDFTQLWKDVTKIFHSMVESIAHFFTGLWHDIVHIAESIYHGVIKFFKLLLKVAITIFEFTTPIGLFIKFHKVIFHIAETIWKDITGFFAKIAKDLLRWAWQAVLWVKNEFFKLVHFLENIGMEAIHGLINGAKHAMGAVKKFAGHAVHDVVHFFTSGFGIFSPSRVMADSVGTPLIQGIHKGMANEIPKAEAAVHGFISAWKNSWNGAAKDTGGSITAISHSLDALRVVLARSTGILSKFGDQSAIVKAAKAVTSNIMAMVFAFRDLATVVKRVFGILNRFIFGVEHIAKSIKVLMHDMGSMWQIGWGKAGGEAEKAVTKMGQAMSHLQTAIHRGIGIILRFAHAQYDSLETAKKLNAWLLALQIGFRNVDKPVIRLIASMNRFMKEVSAMSSALNVLIQNMGNLWTVNWGTAAQAVTGGARVMQAGLAKLEDVLRKATGILLRYAYAIYSGRKEMKDIAIGIMAGVYAFRDLARVVSRTMTVIETFEATVRSLGGTIHVLVADMHNLWTIGWKKAGDATTKAVAVMGKALGPLHTVIKTTDDRLKRFSFALYNAVHQMTRAYTWAGNLQIGFRNLAKPITRTVDSITAFVTAILSLAKALPGFMHTITTLWTINWDKASKSGHDAMIAITKSLDDLSHAVHRTDLIVMHFTRSAYETGKYITDTNPKILNMVYAFRDVATVVTRTANLLTGAFIAAVKHGASDLQSAITSMVDTWTKGWDNALKSTVGKVNTMVAAIDRLAKAIGSARLTMGEFIGTEKNLNLTTNVTTSSIMRESTAFRELEHVLSAEIGLERSLVSLTNSLNKPVASATAAPVATGSSGGVTINITGNTLLNNASAQQLAQIVSKALATNIIPRSRHGALG